MKIGIKVLPFLVLLLAPLASYGQQETASVEITLKTIGGDLADYHGVSLKIYQDNAKISFETLASITGNPYKAILPSGHLYKIESYVNSMYATVGYVNLENNDKQLQLTLPNTGSARFLVFYNDGITPIDNATVMLRSNDGTYTYWTNGTTDSAGATFRFWLQPTISNYDYYVATVVLAKNLQYNYSSIVILPGTSKDIKITTPWPSAVSQLTVSLLKSTSQKVSGYDGNFAVQLYDRHDNKIAESKANQMGDAYFSNLKVGSYVLRVIDLNYTKTDWGVTSVVLDGSQTFVQIFKNSNQTDYEKTNDPPNGIITTSGTSISQDKIPPWVKADAKLWSQNQVSDSDFLKGIQYLIQQGIMNIPATPTTSDPVPQQIPSWVRSNAAWWSQGQISDNDFVKSMEYLISNGMIQV
ncbi:MAG: hypothetical protein ACREBI_10975 [Nitrosotalea sp.]